MKYTEEELRAAYADCIGKKVLVQFRGNMQLAMHNTEVHRLAVSAAKSQGVAEPAAPDQDDISLAFMEAPAQDEDGNAKVRQNLGGEMVQMLVVTPAPAVPCMIGVLGVQGHLLKLTYRHDSEHPERNTKLMHPDDVVGVDRIEADDEA